MWLLLFLVTSVGARLEWQCPYFWEIDRSTNFCYKVFRQYVSSEIEAENVCAGYNAKLGAINTNFTLKVVDEIFAKGWRIPKMEYPSDRVWISSQSLLKSPAETDGSLKCASYLPSRVSQKGQVLSIPCMFPDGNSRPHVQHILCAGDFAEKTEVTLFCEDGWSLFSDRKVCHKLFQVGISSIDGAEAFCNAHSANLSMLLTVEEKAFVQDLMTNAWNVSRLLFPLDQVWVGLKKVKPDLFQWANGQKVDTNDTFGTWEPNGRFDVEPCVTISPMDVDRKQRKGGLVDISCDNWQFYWDMENIVNQILCEKPAISNKEDLSAASSAKMEPCTAEWNIFKGEKCHKFFQIGVTTMDGAQKICEGKGGRLSSIQTKEEMAFVTDLMLRGWKISGNDTFYNHIWVSLRRDEEIGKWRWNGKDEMKEELGKVASNKLERSHCAAYQPMNFLNGKDAYFGEVPCDTAVLGQMYPPSHILCERDHDESIAPIPLNSLECPEKWHFNEKDDMCIKLFVEDTYSYLEAQNRCISEGGNLISMSSQEKKDFVIGITRIGWRLRMTSLLSAVVWIGLRKEENSWKWLNGETFNGKLGQTDNVKDQKHCAIMIPSYGDLKDFKCELSGSPIEHFICEKDSLSKSTKNNQIYIRLALCVLLFFVLVAALWIVFRLISWKSRRNAYGFDSYALEKLLGPDTTLDYAAPFLSLDPVFEIPTKKVELIEEIGHGFFGIVWKAKLHHPKKMYRNIDVAVKLVRDTKDKEQCASIATEIKFLSNVGIHPNVIRFIGATTTQTSRHGNMLIMEFCSNGNLKDHLISMGRNRENQSTEDAGLASFALQIANGMQYLSSIPCIHRDLAARNVLLTEKFICKITDFGLAKNEDYYKGVTSRCLPLRWMAPESIENRRFTLKSDIWSFGIVLFEIYSFGSVPYTNIHQKDLIPALLSRTINEIPAGTPEKIASLMTDCWKSPSFTRPTFTECYFSIKEFLSGSYPEKWNEIRSELEQTANAQFSLDEWLPSGKKTKKNISLMQ